MLAVKVGELSVDFTGDNYKVSGNFDLLNDGVKVHSAILSVSGFLYEAGNIKASIKNRLLGEVIDWFKSYKRDTDYHSALAEIRTDLQTDIDSKLAAV